MYNNTLRSWNGAGFIPVDIRAIVNSYQPKIDNWFRILFSPIHIRSYMPVSQIPFLWDSHAQQDTVKSRTSLFQDSKTYQGVYNYRCCIYSTASIQANKISFHSNRL